MSAFGAIRAVAFGGVVVLTLAVVWASRVGNLTTEGLIVLGLPWGVVTFLDLYIGFLLVAGWILFREAKPQVAVLWIVSILALGNLASCLYVLLAARRAGGDLSVFWLGARRTRIAAARR